MWRPWPCSLVRVRVGVQVMIRYGGGGRESMDLLGKVYESKMSGEKVKRAGNVTRGPKAKWQPQERKEFSLQSS